MVAKNAALTANTSTKTEIFYPETDDMPLPDGFYQHSHFWEIISVLNYFFRLRDDVVVAGDIFIYYVEGNPNLRMAPDCFVVFGVSRESFERNNTYLMWDVGKSPDFVLEIGSPSTARNDLEDKRELYASLGIGEYWRFDPSGGDHYGEPLVGETLVDGEYHALEMVRGADGSVRGYSATLSLELHWEEGRLLFYDPVEGRWLANMEEAGVAREAAEAQVESERSARESAEARAETAEARAAELEAELQRLRGE
ncbi:MAG: Uma2 family endonuclease [Dehalococcoidia bacterium]|nr:Uma2 family endonuclease [Dehalococcoidia bacterium]